MPTAGSMSKKKWEHTLHIFSEATLHYTVARSEAWPWHLQNSYPRKLVQQSTYPQPPNCFVCICVATVHFVSDFAKL